MDFLEIMNGVKLAAGAHGKAGASMCAMEMVAFLEGLPHSDSPACTSPILAAYTRRLNDGMPDAHRNMLLPYLPRLVGTVAPEFEQARAEHLAWKACTVIVPMTLRARGRTALAEQLAAMPLPTSRGEWQALSAAADAAGADAAGAAAAYAADAAVYANAADAAAYAAHAAYYDAACLPDYTAALQMLDEAIAIGPSSGFTKPLPEPGVAAHQLGMVDA